MNAFGAFIAEQEPSIDGFIDHMQHGAAVAGPDRVAIGADFIEDLVHHLDPILGRQLLVRPEDLSFIGDFKAPEHFANLGPPLVERVGAEQAQRFASRNMLDFFRKNLP